MAMDKSREHKLQQKPLSYDQVFIHLSLNVLWSKHFLPNIIFYFKLMRKIINQIIIRNVLTVIQSHKPRRTDHHSNYSKESPETPVSSHLSAEDKCCRRCMLCWAIRAGRDWYKPSPPQRIPKLCGHVCRGRQANSFSLNNCYNDCNHRYLLSTLQRLHRQEETLFW